MGLECGWRHAQKSWSWEFEEFKKELRSIVEGNSWIFRISIGRDELRSLTSYDAPYAAVGGVSIVWFAYVFRICVSLLVSLRTEARNKKTRSYPKR